MEWQCTLNGLAWLIQLFEINQANHSTRMSLSDSFRFPVIAIQPAPSVTWVVNVSSMVRVEDVRLLVFFSNWCDWEWATTVKHHWFIPPLYACLIVQSKSLPSGSFSLQTISHGQSIQLAVPTPTHTSVRLSAHVINNLCPVHVSTGDGVASAVIVPPSEKQKGGDPGKRSASPSLPHTTAKSSAAVKPGNMDCSSSPSSSQLVALMDGQLSVRNGNTPSSQSAFRLLSRACT